jgi:hypothetical protein
VISKVFSASAGSKRKWLGEAVPGQQALRSAWTRCHLPGQHTDRGMYERSQHNVAWINMRATHAILPWNPDGRNADDVTSRAK